jgi:hypothetical protein
MESLLPRPKRRTLVERKRHAADGTSDSSPRRLKRRYLVLIGCLLAAIVATVAVSCIPWRTKTAHITLCAVDPAYAHAVEGASAQDYCGPGDFQAVHGSQLVIAQSYDKDGHLIQSPKFTFTVSGANATTSTVTGSGGSAEFSYIGTQAGGDNISASFADGTKTAPVTPAVVRWLRPTHDDHPILFVHGINEDASDYETLINPSFVDSEPQPSEFPATEKSEQVFTALIGGLELKYDPTYMEAFCYVDDQAWLNSPSGCPSGESAICPATMACISQSPVDVNAIALDKEVEALHARANRPVTIIAYSMGAAVTRAMLSGCRTAQAYLTSGAPDPDVAEFAASRFGETDAQACASDFQGACSTPSPGCPVDNVFFFDGAQQGSWLLEANKYLNAAKLAGGPFPPILSTIQQTIFAKFEQVSGGVDATQPAAADMTPGSLSVLGHDTVPIPASIAIYNFYGDVRLSLGVTVAGIYYMPGHAALDLGDLLMLPQDDPARRAPNWGGAGLCDGCPTPAIPDSVPSVAPYREAGSLSSTGQPQFHAWLLMQSYALDIDVLAPNLTVASAKSAFSQVTSSPVWHLQTTQPVTMAPGSAIQVADVTGATTHTDVPTEVLLVLTRQDGLSIP